MPPKPAAKPAAAAAKPAAPPPLDPEAEFERRTLIEECKLKKMERITAEAELAQFHEEKARFSAACGASGCVQNAAWWNRVHPIGFRR